MKDHAIDMISDPRIADRYKLGGNKPETLSVTTMSPRSLRSNQVVR